MGFPWGSFHGRRYRGISDDLFMKRQQTRRLRADPHGSQITDKTPCVGVLAGARRGPWPRALGAARARRGAGGPGCAVSCVVRGVAIRRALAEGGHGDQQTGGNVGIAFP